MIVRVHVAPIAEFERQVIEQGRKNKCDTGITFVSKKDFCNDLRITAAAEALRRCLDDFQTR